MHISNQQHYEQHSPTKQQQHQQQTLLQQASYQQPQHQHQAQTSNIRSTAIQSSHLPSGSVQDGYGNSFYDTHDATTYARPNSNAPINMYNNNNHHHHHNQQQHQHQPQPPHYQTPQNYYNNGGGGGVASTGGDIVNSMAAMGIGSGGPNAKHVNGGNIGKIADYDPLTDGPRNVPNTARQSTTLIYSSTTGERGGPGRQTK